MDIPNVTFLTEAVESQGDISLFAVKLTVILCSMTALSQLILIAISRGLQGDFSARTFMMTQAVAEIFKRLFIISYGCCNLFGKPFRYVFYSVAVSSFRTFRYLSNLHLFK